MDNYRELDLREIAMAWLHKIWIIALCAVVVGMGAYIYTVKCVKPLYKASVSMYVNNSRVQNTQHSGISASDLATSQRLVTTYIAILNSDKVMDQVAQEVGVRYTANAIRSMLSAQSVNETEVFQVFISHPDPQMAMDIANAVANVAPTVISEIVEGSSTQVIDYAKLPGAPYSPNRVKNAVGGAAIGLLLSLVGVAVVTVMDVRIKTEEDLAEISDAPVLGRIPNFDSDHGNGYSYVSKGTKERKAGKE